LNLASSRSTNGSVGATLFGSSATVGFLPPPSFPHQFPSTIPASGVFLPSVFVFDKSFRNPRTFSATVGYVRQRGPDLGVPRSHTHARTDVLTPFFRAQHPACSNE